MKESYKGEDMSKVLVFGHQNPDTDTIASAISFAYLQKQLGIEAEAVALGEANEETKFALNKFDFEPLRAIEEAKPEADKVMLVDHNEFQQSVSDIKDVEIISVIDHHRIANFETANPLYMRVEPVGCANTIIYKMYKENNIEIPADIAGLMLSAIISDTLLFKSPTCTPEDEEVALSLAKIAGVDAQEYGLEMLKAGTNLSVKSDNDLLNMDSKSFTMGGKTVRIGQVNTVDEAEVLARQESLEAAMVAQNADNQYDLFVLIITNILTSDSVILVVGEPKAKVEEAFGAQLENSQAVLKGVVSRKKQVVPQLTEAFEK